MRRSDVVGISDRVVAEAAGAMTGKEERIIGRDEGSLLAVAVSTSKLVTVGTVCEGPLFNELEGSGAGNELPGVL